MPNARSHYFLVALSVVLAVPACASSDFGTAGCALDTDCPMGDVCNLATRACATPTGTSTGGASGAAGRAGSAGASSGAAGTSGGPAGGAGGTGGSGGASGATGGAGTSTGGAGSSGAGGSVGQFTWSWNGAVAHSFTGKGEYQAGPGADQVSVATTVSPTAPGYCLISRHGPGPLSPGSYDIVDVPTSVDQFQLQCVTAATPTTTATVIGTLGKLTITLSSGSELVGMFTSTATNGTTNEVATTVGTFDLPCKAFCQ